MPSTAVVRTNSFSPHLVQRWFSISRDGASIKLNFWLEEIVPGRLYVVPHHFRRGDVVLRKGEILSRNLELGHRLELDPKRQGDEVFLVYTDIYDALRGLLQINSRYETIESPRLKSWERTLAWVIELAWAMYDPAVDREVDLKQATGAVADREALVRDPRKVLARDKMVGVSLRDRRGRRNPGRLPPIFWSADDLLEERRRVTRAIGRKIDDRIYALAEYLDRIFHFVEECDRLASQMLLNRVTMSGNPRLVIPAAIQLERTAMRLSAVSVRPFGPHAFQHTAEDFNEAANALRDRRMDEVRERLDRARRAMRLLQRHRQIEEILVALSPFKDGKRGISEDDRARLALELGTIDQALREPELEKGFQNPVLPQVLEHLGSAWKELSELEPDLRRVYEKLKAATAPF